MAELLLRCPVCLRILADLNTTNPRVCAECKLPLEELSIDRFPVKSDDPSIRFVANASVGPEVPASGFIRLANPEWIAAEATYLYGQLEMLDDDRSLRSESLQPVFFFSHGQPRSLVRDVKLAKNAVFTFDGKALRPSSKTLGLTGPQTLMSLEAGLRFIRSETVAIGDLYSHASEGLKRFSNLDWDMRLYDVVVCVVISSYFYDLFNAFPIVMIMGPFETGKTRLLLSIIYMGHRGIPILDPTEASIFRTAEAWKGFLGIDEFWEIGKEIERLLRATYKRGMKVPRIDKTKGGLMTLSLLDLFGKVAVASQEPFPPNIVSKGVLFHVRKMPDPNPEKRDPTPEDFEEFRSKAYIARLTWPVNIKQHADHLDRQDLGLTGRDYEVWKPSLTIASMIGGKVWENVLSYAKESSQQKRQESYEELKEVIEAIYDLIKDAKGHFPLSFRPKQIHDLIWERLKDEYRVTKERQEVEGEAAEKYDYDTRRFEEVYRVHKIGRNYLQQLGVKGEHKKRGTIYQIRSGEEFHGLVTRYHPDLPQEEDSYSKLVLDSKILSLLSPSSPEADLHRKKSGFEVTIQRDGNVTDLEAEKTRRRGLGDISDICDNISGVSPSSTAMPKPPFSHIAECAICRERSPLRPDKHNEWYVCQTCYDASHTVEG